MTLLLLQKVIHLFSDQFIQSCLNSTIILFKYSFINWFIQSKMFGIRWFIYSLTQFCSVTVISNYIDTIYSLLSISVTPARVRLCATNFSCVIKVSGGGLAPPLHLSPLTCWKDAAADMINYTSLNASVLSHRLCHALTVSLTWDCSKVCGRLRCVRSRFFYPVFGWEGRGASMIMSVIFIIY